MAQKSCFHPANVLFDKKNRTQYTQPSGKNNKKSDIPASFYGSLP
jgi:hypothetical protein